MPRCARRRGVSARRQRRFTARDPDSSPPRPEGVPRFFPGRAAWGASGRLPLTIASGGRMAYLYAARSAGALSRATENHPLDGTGRGPSNCTLVSLFEDDHGVRGSCSTEDFGFGRLRAGAARGLPRRRGSPRADRGRGGGRSWTKGRARNGGAAWRGSSLQHQTKDPHRGARPNPRRRGSTRPRPARRRRRSFA